MQGKDNLLCSRIIWTRRVYSSVIRYPIFLISTGYTVSVELREQEFKNGRHDRVHVIKGPFAILV